MNFPQSVLKIVAKAAKVHEDDVDKAVDAAVAKIRALAEYEEIVDQLVRRAIRDLIHDARHQTTKTIKRESGYKIKTKISVGRSQTVARVETEIYGLCIAGRTLGVLLGSELESAASTEEAIGNGHLVNATLLRKLRPLVADGCCVRECVPASRIRVILRNIQKNFRNAA